MKKMMKQENWSPFWCRLHHSVLSPAFQIMSKIFLLFIAMPSFCPSPYLFLSYALELYTVFKMSYIVLSIIMYLILTMQCSYVKFIIQMVVCIKMACLIAACGETMLQGSYVPLGRIKWAFLFTSWKSGIWAVCPKPIHLWQKSGVSVSLKTGSLLLLTSIASAEALWST